MFWWSNRHSEETVKRIRSAFPFHLSDDVHAVLQVVPQAEHEPSDDVIDVAVQSERVRIPSRVYFPEPAASVMATLSPRQHLVLAAIFSRHRDGFVRERWLRQIRPSGESWVPPFVVQLLGEYVLEIASAIEHVIPADRTLYRTFADANPDFCRVVSARMINYWALYYRRGIPSFDDYPAYRAACQLGVWSGRPPRNRVAR